MVETCEICGTTENIQKHHVSYEPEIIQLLCVGCHKAVHNHGVGKALGWTPLFKWLKEDAEILFKEGATNREVAKACDISRATASHWRKKLGLIIRSNKGKGKGKVRYIRINKEIRRARLGIIEEEDVVNFIDHAMDEKLSRTEKEGKKRK